MISNRSVLVTGASGFVGTKLVNLLNENGFNVVGVDRLGSPGLAKICDIRELCLEELDFDRFIIVHCAAARTDYGLTPNEYWRDNVDATNAFLSKCNPRMIDYFVHFSSVAAFDGLDLHFSADMTADDAYRFTKYEQERIIDVWCQANEVPFSVVYPSAIFDESAPRLDTNIGKLQLLVRYFPITPVIPVRKSRTNIDKLCAFVLELLSGHRRGRFMTIETPVETVEEIWCRLGGIGKLRLRLFLSQSVLNFAADVESLLRSVTKHKPFITRARVIKLFRDTSYDRVKNQDINCEAYEQCEI